MKELTIIIKAQIDERSYDNSKANGMTDPKIRQAIREAFNASKVDSQFVEDFEVETVGEEINYPEL
jgi:hypothetical protein